MRGGGRPVARFVLLAAFVTAIAATSPVRLSAAEDEDARIVFRDLLQLTRKAAKLHFLVTRPEWTDVGRRWRRASGGRDARVRRLRRCWPPLKSAREAIERAHVLFTVARGREDDAYDQFQEHKRLLTLAETRVGRAEACYDAAVAQRPAEDHRDH